MNFGTFLGYLFLILFWNVCFVIRYFITHVLMDPAVSKADKYWGKKFKEMDEEFNEKCNGKKEQAEKRTIGFQTGEFINERKES